MSAQEETVKGEVSKVLTLQQQLQKAEDEIMQIERFRDFLQFQKDAKEKIDMFWKAIETTMIDNNVKSVKGDWGSLTIAERLNWTYDPSQLAPKFFKKIVDTKKLSDTFRLEGKPPKAATPSYSKYIVKRLK